jgi:hypothetical protein
MSISRILATASASLLLALPATAAMTSCKMTYSIKGWSAFYKGYKGNGSVTCQNGQRASVSVVTRGGGVTFGRSEIDNGAGAFSGVKDISEIFGTYFAVDGHAGATKSAEGRAMTKGKVSLALRGTGRGFDLGFSFGAFTIERK